MSAPAVLYVEDEDNDVLFMQMAWKRAGLGFPLHIARNGSEAIDYLAGNATFSDREQHPLPSLVILDLNLPMISGLEVLEWIRQQQTPLQQLPVVILTSSDQTRDIEQGEKLGADEFITKPSAPEDLMQVVQRLADLWLKPARR